MSRNQSDSLKPTSVSCAWVQERLCDLFDGVLAGGERERVLSHLETCTHCQKERVGFSASESALTKSVSLLPSPGDMSAEFYARLAAEQRKPARSWRGSWAVAVPALAMCAFGLVFWKPAKQPDNLPAPTEGMAQIARESEAKPTKETENVRLAQVAPVFMAEKPSHEVHNVARHKTRTHRRFTKRSPVLVASVTQADKKEKVLPPAWNLALSKEARYNESTTDFAYHRKEELAVEPTTLDFEVKDEERGFESSMRIASVGETANGGSVLTFEDAGSPNNEETDTNTDPTR